MEPKDKWTRRDFSVASALAILGGVTITVTGCGDSTGSTTTTPTPPTQTTPPAPTDATGNVGANHGHTAVVTAAQQSAGNTIVIDIQGSSSHPHTVQLTGPDLGQIVAGNRLTKTSSTDSAHNHSVTFN